jgi:hypothetical protein
LPDGVSLSVLLRAADPLTEEWLQLEASRADLGSYAAGLWPETVNAAFDESGAAQLTARRPGAHELSLQMVVHGAAQRRTSTAASAPITDFSPQHIEVQPGKPMRIDLDLPHSAIAEALRTVGLE